MTIVDFEEVGTVRPVLRQPVPKDANARKSQQQPADCEIAIIGAGPYGLSLAAQLAARGGSFRIFGKALDTWRHHMPKDMLLKSEGFGSCLSHPSKDSTLKAYCGRRGIPYADTALPIPLDLFLEYATWFRETYVPRLEELNVTHLEAGDEGFALTLEDGRRVTARRVVLAVGITWFRNVPAELADLDKDVTSHSYDHRDAAQFRGKEVVVLGAGASAVDLAALLNDGGASVKIVARDSALRYHNPPSAADNTWWKRLRNPPTTIGPGWRSWAAANMPYLFRFLPEELRLEIVKRHLGPAPGWFVRQRVEGKVTEMLSCKLDAARMVGKRVLLRVTDKRGEARTVECDHVVAATGFKPELSRMRFIARPLLSRIATTGGAPRLSGTFETTARGLYVIGPASANSFGPLMRFMTGAEYAAPVLARHLARKAKD
ncbi:MAG TPA: NAD(P)-binding domain-containing protein [Rhizomicrobium sp.]|nr:NAD(P)-binding domain-containing protein [Rhizomicrobium sp.]